MQSAGQSLRGLREQLGLTMRDVESAAARIADRHHNEEYAIPPSRLSDIETKGIVPSIYRIYTLAVIYRQDLRNILSLYGVDFNQSPVDLGLSQPPKSHVSSVFQSVSAVHVPVKLDPGFDLRRTANLGRMVEKWGILPLSYLGSFAKNEFTYG